MAIVVVVVSLFIVALGAVGVLAPDRLISHVKTWQTRKGLYGAAGIRLVLGVAMVLAAPSSKAPDTMCVLGVFAIIAGLVTPFLGLQRFRKLVDWWVARGSGSAFTRLWGGVAVAIGVLLAYWILP